MIYIELPPDVDLFQYLHEEPPAPVTYKHVKRQTHYSVVSDGECILNTFSLEGSVHDLFLHGRHISCEFQFSGQICEDGKAAPYGGPITIYKGSDGKYWARPTHEFHDGRFERID